MDDQKPKTIPAKNPHGLKLIVGGAQPQSNTPNNGQSGSTNSNHPLIKQLTALTEAIEADVLMLMKL
jgi:hypothetical protein